jgi:hypothetical protein
MEAGSRTTQGAVVEEQISAHARVKHLLLALLPDAFVPRCWDCRKLTQTYCHIETS